jgi:hypothetical protein
LRFRDYTYALTQRFALAGVTSLLILETPEFFDPRELTGKEISFMSDNTLLLGIDAGTDLMRTIRVVKSRGSAHEGRRRVLRIGADGIVVDEARPSPIPEREQGQGHEGFHEETIG